ncbi:chromosomal replication initiator protein DnaA [Patescibacteria group bacterium]|nr:chromosomal replication initiator protein DnaA [Patescibacteria group bacterium]
MNPNEIWQATLGELELTLSKANFTTWFKNTFISSLDEGKVSIAVPNTFTKAWLEKKYHESIVRALRNATNNNVREVTYKVEVRNTTQIPGFSNNENMESSYQVNTLDSPMTTETREDEYINNKDGNGLNPRYLFDAFVVGKTNELAHASAMAVAANPGLTYNPLFLFGGAGLGKTHLLQAIGHYVLEKNAQAKVLYVTCEKFTNDFIQSVRSGKAKDFKETYRNLDVLLIDDIQFIAGKEGTMEEFFHTFNALHQINKQIVITSDRQAKDIQGLESRLVSRVEWGMTADVSSPDFETRVAILERKCSQKNYQLNMEILRYVAGTIQSNVRELEGALNKVIAYHQFKNIEPTMSSVQNLLQSFVPTVPKRTITPRRLLEIVVEYYDIKMDEIMGKSREQRFAFPRQVAMYLLREEAKCSFPAIGKHIGGRDHTTAMHACHKVDTLLKTDDQLKRDLNLMREKVYMGDHSG